MFFLKSEFLTICQKFNTRDSINGLSLMTRDNVKKEETRTFTNPGSIPDERF